MTDRDLIAEGRAAWLDTGENFEIWAVANFYALLNKMEQLQHGGKYLGEIVHRNNRIALDATGLHHLIDENGDGDWQAVWENVADLGATLAKLRTDRAQELAAIAARQQRDRERVAQALKLIDLHAGYALTALVRNALEGGNND